MNPAAGGGRCGKLAAAALERVRRPGSSSTSPTRAAGRSDRARPRRLRARHPEFPRRRRRRHILRNRQRPFPEALTGGRPALGFLPLGTGNSFLRDFTTRGVEHTIEALKNGSRRACDVIRLRHARRRTLFHQSAEPGLSRRRRRARRIAASSAGANSATSSACSPASPARASCVSASPRRRRRMGPPPLPVSRFQQQQVHRRQNDDRAESRPHRRPDRIRPLVARRPAADCSGLFPRLFTGTHIDHPLASRAPRAARRLRSRRACERDGRWRNSAPRVPVAGNSARARWT